MSQQQSQEEAQAGATARRRTVVVIVGVAIALLIGLVAVITGAQGLAADARPADAAAAWPNLLTGIASLVGGVGYWLGKKWGLYAYALSVLGHFAVHSAFFVASVQGGRASVGSTLALSIIPVVSLLVLLSMEQQPYRGRLS